MEFNKNSVLTIIEENFWNTLVRYIAECADGLDGDELECFEELVDYVELDSVYGLSVDNIEVEVDGESLIVMGELEADVCLNGFAYWCGESILVDSAEHFMGFTFSFEVLDGGYDAFEMEYWY